MKVSVWDTYVKRQDGLIMHFDILVPSVVIDEVKIFQYGNDYLEQKPFKTDELSTKECVFCHIEIAPPSVISEIQQKGFSIIEMENCN